VDRKGTSAKTYAWIGIRVERPRQPVIAERREEVEGVVESNAVAGTTSCPLRVLMRVARVRSGIGEP